MGKHATAQDSWFKGQRVLRTIGQVCIPAFLTFAVVLLQIIQALGLPVDSGAYGRLLAAAGFVTAIAGGLFRVMAIPAVNQWLTSIVLGSVSKSQAQNTPAAITPADPEQPAAGVPPSDASWAFELRHAPAAPARRRERQASWCMEQ
jgi:hypothetical protein